MVKISGPSDDVCEGKSLNYYADDYDSGMELRWRLDAPNSFETYFGIHWCPGKILKGRKILPNNSQMAFCTYLN